MTVDAAGDLWVAIYGGGRVNHYAPDGSLRHVYPIPARECTCCAFGGPGLHRLFVTTATEGWTDEQRRSDPAAGLVYRVDTDATGRPAAPFRPDPAWWARLHPVKGEAPPSRPTGAEARPSEHPTYMTVGIDRGSLDGGPCGRTPRTTSLMASCNEYCLSQGHRRRAEPPLGWSTTRHHAIGGPARPFLPDADWILSRSCENLLDPRASCNRGREASRRYGQ